jgi:hypothetical protein
MSNPLLELVNITNRGSWYSLADFSNMFGFQLKYFGVDYSTDDELMLCIKESLDIGFIEISSDGDDSKLIIKIKDMWYDYAKSI